MYSWILVYSKKKKVKISTPMTILQQGLHISLTVVPKRSRVLTELDKFKIYNLQQTEVTRMALASHS